MEDQFGLEGLIEQGLHINPQDFSAVQSWLEVTYNALASFPEERQRLDVACFQGSTAQEKMERGLEILNAAVERLRYPQPEPLCYVNCR